MELFEIKRQNLAKVEGNGLEKLAREMFPDCKVESGQVIVRFGAMQPLRAWVENKKLGVEIITDASVDGETALKSISLRNKFLEAATGYTAKERLKKLKKAE